MKIPCINREAVVQQAEAAQEMMAAYTQDLERISGDLQLLRKEKIELAAIIGYLERAETRQAVLHACLAFGEEYISKGIGGYEGTEDLAQFLAFMITLDSCIASSERSLRETQEAIELLRSDVELLSVISEAHFRQIFSYMAVNAPGWSFNKFSFGIRPRSQGLTLPGDGLPYYFTESSNVLRALR